MPIADSLRARRFPIVTTLLIVANFAVWIFLELPDINGAVAHGALYPCTVNGACHRAEPWAVNWFTAMFMHGSWDHILGNMLFLAVFGKNVEDAMGRLRYLGFYVAGGFVASATQTAMTLLFGTAAEARVPLVGASGAIAAVLGAFWILYPNAKIITYIPPIFTFRVPAWIFLGLWFVYQLVEANSGLFAASGKGGGVAFFAHVGGFVFGALVAMRMRSSGQERREASSGAAGAWA
jgi:membrane associated rhomboid family serine protease